MKIIKPILLGIIAAGGALVFEFIFSLFFPGIIVPKNLFLQTVTLSLVIAAAIEESFKFLVIYKSFFCLENSKNIILSSLLFGLGFSLAEIAILNLSEISYNFNVYMNILGIIFIHMLTSVFIGYMILKLKKITPFLALAIILLAFAAHLSYNAAIIHGYLQK